jgi:hypothetical protein
MRWYNPSLRGFEWRNSPEGDEEALTILDESVTSRSYVEVYWRWRNLGATVMASLIRVGEAAKEADDAKRARRSVSPCAAYTRSAATS